MSSPKTIPRQKHFREQLGIHHGAKEGANYSKFHAVEIQKYSLQDMPGQDKIS